MKVRNFLAIFSLALLFGIPSTMNGASIYVMFDDQCMDRLEYKYINRTDGSEHVVYQISTSTSGKLFLEVGTESQSYQSAPPAQVIGCNNTLFGERLVDDINNRFHQVFLVTSKGNRRYIVSQVKSAAYMTVYDNLLTYKSPDYQFRFNINGGTIGENISTSNNDSKVFFEGKMENECSGLYLFRQKSSQQSLNPLTDLVIAPEVGIVEERAGRSVDESLLNTLRLDRVDGLPLDRHLRKLCSDDPVVDGTLTMKGVPLDFEGATPAQPTEPADDGKSSETEAKGRTHIVSKGETLYRISKKYNVTVSQIKNWNNLKSNTIYRGQELKVSEASLPSKVATATASVPNTTTKGGPAPYESTGQGFQWDSNNSAAKPTVTNNQKATINNGEPAWSTTAGYHRVQPGETVASIAMQYGFTEDRFRDLNNLGANDYVKYGQVLVTTDCRNCPTTNGNNSNVPSPANYYQPTQSGTMQNKGLTAKTPYSSGTNNSSYGTSQGYNSSISNSPNFSDEVPKSYETPVVNPELPSAYKYVPREKSLDNIYPAAYNTSNTTTKSGNRIIHVVKDGESLYGIARKYSTTVQSLRSLNNLEKNEVIIPYQRLYIN